MGRLTASRGEIWLVDLGMIQKVRPALILSVPYKGQERAIVSFVIRTTSTRGTEYEVPHIGGDCQMNRRSKTNSQLHNSAAFLVFSMIPFALMSNPASHGAVTAGGMPPKGW